MRKYNLPITISVFLVTAVLPLFAVVAAATLTLDSIGVLSTNGVVYDEWWYTGTLPTLTGNAGVETTVDVTVNDSTQSTTADSSGVWSFYSEALIVGDHSVVISSGEESLSFTLHLGQSYPGDTSSTTESTSIVPETGSTAFFMLLGATSIIAIGWYFWGKNNNSIKAFEKNITQNS